VTPRFWHGCNYPWSRDGATVLYGMDFGRNVWGSHLGVSTRRDAVAADVARLAALGFTVARWFVFCDGRAGIVYDERGYPTGLDDACMADLDAALEIASAVHLQLCLVLLDHRWMYAGIPGRATGADAVQLVRHNSDLVSSQARALPHGRASVLHERDGRDALFDHVLGPVVTRYGPKGARADLAGAVLAWELMNEPDFIVKEWRHCRSRHVKRPLPFAVVAECVARFSDLVHTTTSALTTLAAARVRNLAEWQTPALGVDLLQLHSYPDVRLMAKDVDVFGTPARALVGDRPLVLGEFPGNGPQCHPPHCAPPPTTLGEYLEFALQGGYAGAWPWSFSGTDDYGPLPEAPLLAFARAHPELVNPLCRA
jgi:hypothetical protein